MQLPSRQEQGVLILTPAATRIDAPVAIAFRDAILQAVGDHAGPVVVNLGAVAFMDSSGLGAVVACYRQFGLTRPFLICNLTLPVLSLFQATRMDRVLKVVAEEADALTRCRVS